MILHWNPAAWDKLYTCRRSLWDEGMKAFHWKVSFVLLTQPTAICHLLYQCKLQTFIGVASSKMVIGHDVFVRRVCRITRGILSTATAAVPFLRLVQQPDHKRRLTYDQYNSSLLGIVQEVRWEGLGEEGIGGIGLCDANWTTQGWEYFFAATRTLISILPCWAI